MANLSHVTSNYFPEYCSCGKLKLEELFSIFLVFSLSVQLHIAYYFGITNTTDRNYQLIIRITTHPHASMSSIFVFMLSLNINTKMLDIEARRWVVIPKLNAQETYKFVIISKYGVLELLSQFLYIILDVRKIGHLNLRWPIFLTSSIIYRNCDRSSRTPYLGIMTYLYVSWAFNSIISLP